MIERSQVRVPAGAAGEFSSPGSAFCADSDIGLDNFKDSCILTYLTAGP